MSAEHPHTPTPAQLVLAQRWRLILGRYADQALQRAELSQLQQQLEHNLDYLYRHDDQQRGIAPIPPPQGTLDASSYTAIDWLQQSRKLFPKSTFKRMQQRALLDYRIKDLLANADSIRQLDANPATLKLLLSMRGQLSPEVTDALRTLIDQVVQQLLAQLRPQFQQALSGRRCRFRRTAQQQAQNFDWRASILHNLKHYQIDRQQLILHKPLFNARMQRHISWEIVLCVDQSSSMMDSVMHAAVCASILAALPTVRSHLILFDTQIVDLSHLADNPVEVLLGIQLGGGTNISQALRYCATKISDPQHSVVILISDFDEGASFSEMYQATAALHQQGTKLLGLAALDASARPCFNHHAAEQLQQRGMQIAAMTPDHLARWLAELMQ